MDAPQENNPQRKSFRCQTCEPDRKAELCFNEQRLAVRLLDQSAGGFGVVADRRPRLSRGAVGQLHLDSAVFEVRVAYVGEMEPADSRRRPFYRIGLQRLGEGVTPDEGDSAPWSWPETVLQGTDTGPRSSAIGVGIALAVVVVGIPLALTALMRHVSVSKPKPDVSAAREKAAESPPGETAARSARGRSAPPERLPNPPGGAEASSPEPPSTSDWVRLVHLPGASAFVIPRTIQELGLSSAQQQQMREIVDQTGADFKQLDAKSSRMTREEQSRYEEKLLQSAREKSLAVLTPEQRQRFQALLDLSQQSKTDPP